jgi:uracil-DNA glycosylase family 4
VPPDLLPTLADEIVRCKKCPRLVQYLSELKDKKKKEFRDWEYWARPLPGFGDPKARLLVVGLAPAAHGGARTGRVFTGDASADFLFPALHRAGFASQPTSTRRDDGQVLTDCFISLAARCAPPENKPLPDELANCRPYLTRELALLTEVKVIVALGNIAFEQVLKSLADRGWAIPRPRPEFAHNRVHVIGVNIVITSYHPSRQNTQTKLLTVPMFDAVFREARSRIAGATGETPPPPAPKRRSRPRAAAPAAGSRRSPARASRSRRR